MNFAAVGGQDTMYIFDNLYFAAVGGQDIMYIFDNLYFAAVGGHVSYVYKIIIM